MHRARRHASVGLALALALTSGAGCQGPAPRRPGRQPSPIAGERTVRLRIVSSPEGGVLALVPVTIGGRGPYPFALDTGATRSLVDQEIAQETNLPSTGRTRAVAGVVATTEAELVRVEEWRIGDVALPVTILLSLPLPRDGGGQSRRSLLGGLLGSDILSQFGAIVVDYDREELVLRPHR